eukprot:gene31325-6472_t
MENATLSVALQDPNHEDRQALATLRHELEQKLASYLREEEDKECCTSSVYSMASSKRSSLPHLGGHPCPKGGFGHGCRSTVFGAPDTGAAGSKPASRAGGRFEELTRGAIYLGGPRRLFKNVLSRKSMKVRSATGTLEELSTNPTAVPGLYSKRPPHVLDYIHPHSKEGSEVVPATAGSGAVTASRVQKTLDEEGAGQGQEGGEPGEGRGDASESGRPEPSPGQPGPSTGPKAELGAASEFTGRDAPATSLLRVAEDEERATLAFKRCHSPSVPPWRSSGATLLEECATLAFKRSVPPWRSSGATLLEECATLAFKRCHSPSVPPWRSSGATLLQERATLAFKRCHSPSVPPWRSSGATLLEECATLAFKRCHSPRGVCHPGVQAVPPS